MDILSFVFVPLQQSTTHNEYEHAGASHSDAPATELNVSHISFAAMPSSLAYVIGFKRLQCVERKQSAAGPHVALQQPSGAL